MQEYTQNFKKLKRYESVDRDAAFSLFSEGKQIRHVSENLHISKNKAGTYYSEWLLVQRKRLNKQNKFREIIPQKRIKEPYFDSEAQIEFMLNPSYDVKDLKGDELEILNNLKHKW